MHRRGFCVVALAALLCAAEARALVGGRQPRGVPAKATESNRSGRKQDGRKPPRLFFKPFKKPRRAFA